MFCRKCGKPIDEGQEYCEECKNAMGMNNQATNQITNQAVNTNNTNENYTNNASNTNLQQKSKIAAGLLGIFLGSLGIHNFYLGYTGKAIAQLLISVLSCGILAFASGIWGLIEGVLILTGSISVDANGVPLKD